MPRSSASDDVAVEPRRSRLEERRTLERVTFRATDEQLSALESLVDADVYHSRSEAIRAGIRQLVERHRLSEADRVDQYGSSSR